MADSKPNTLKLEARREDDGSVTVGVKIDKRFVPVAATPANIVRHHLEDAGEDESDTGTDEPEGSAE